MNERRREEVDGISARFSIEYISEYDKESIQLLSSHFHVFECDFSEDLVSDGTIFPETNPPPGWMPLPPDNLGSFMGPFSTFMSAFYPRTNEGYAMPMVLQLPLVMSIPPYSSRADEKKHIKEKDDEVSVAFCFVYYLIETLFSSGECILSSFTIRHFPLREMFQSQLSNLRWIFWGVMAEARLIIACPLTML